MWISQAQNWISQRAAHSGQGVFWNLGWRLELPLCSRWIGWKKVTLTMLFSWCCKWSNAVQCLVLRRRYRKFRKQIIHIYIYVYETWLVYLSVCVMLGEGLHHHWNIFSGQTCCVRFQYALPPQLLGGVWSGLILCFSDGLGVKRLISERCGLMSDRFLTTGNWTLENGLVMKPWKKTAQGYKHPFCLELPT